MAIVEKIITKVLLPGDANCNANLKVEAVLSDVRDLLVLMYYTQTHRSSKGQISRQSTTSGDKLQHVCVCVCICAFVHSYACWLIIHLSILWKYCDCTKFASLFDSAAPVMQNTPAWIRLAAMLCGAHTGVCLSSEHTHHLTWSSCARSVFKLQSAQV